MKGKFNRSVVFTAILMAVLLAYLSIIGLINFSAAPSFYDGDMYCDYRYAIETWQHKSIFPDGWVFGNQLNVVSTPVLAALFLGLTGNPNMSMAAACVVMAVLVLLSYDWMISAVIKKIESRLAAAVLFITVVLYSGNAIQGNQGWTLLFTMCSYYAGYSISAFLAFGCYIRGFSKSSHKQGFLFPITCVLAFGTGMQSIRQTAIMVGPLLAVEFFRLVFTFGQWKNNRRPLWLAGGITVSNLMGLCCVRMMEINQNQIFGAIELTPLNRLGQTAGNCIFMIKDLLGSDHPESVFVMAGFCLICLVSLILIIKDMIRGRNMEMTVLVLLTGFSVLVIAVIGVFSTMYIRPRYYFMMYPLMSILFAGLYDKDWKELKGLLFGLLAVFFCLACLQEAKDVCIRALTREDEESYQISDYLLEHGFTTVYAVWDHGENVAVASNGEITVGYWHEGQTFEQITYLSNPDVYDATANSCVYFFKDKASADMGMDLAESMGVSLEFLRHFPESNTYIYQASSNLMQMSKG